MCFCVFVSKFTGPSAVIIPARSFVKGQLSCVTLVPMRTLQSKAVQTDQLVFSVLAHSWQKAQRAATESGEDQAESPPGSR